MAEDQDSFEGLGLRPGASVDSVKEAYRLLGARCLSTCACTAVAPTRLSPTRAPLAHDLTRASVAPHRVPVGRVSVIHENIDSD